MINFGFGCFIFLIFSIMISDARNKNLQNFVSIQLAHSIYTGSYLVNPFFKELIFNEPEFFFTQNQERMNIDK